MNDPLKLMVVAAYPDDETLGFGAVLARYAREGVETFLVTATRGERGRYLDHRPGSADHPGQAALAEIRRARPHVVLTFAADGAYGHPDHIAVSKLTTAATLAAVDPNFQLR